MKKFRPDYTRPLLALSVVLASLLALLGSTRPDSTISRDHIELTELTHRYAWAIDTLDRDLLASVFTPQAKAHYVEVGPEILGLDVRLDGFDEIWEWLHGGLGHRKGPAGLPWHFMSNHLIEVDGDEARMRYYMHNRPMAAGGVYYVAAVRTSQGWRISDLRLEEQIWKPTAYSGQSRPPMKKGAAGNRGRE